MRKFLLFCILLAGAFLLGRDAIRSGRLERYLDEHPQMQFNPQVEYYWGFLAALMGHDTSSEYRFNRVMVKYPDSPYAADAWAEILGKYYDRNDRPRLVKESRKFLEKYPDHAKADLIRRRLSFIEHGL